MDRGRVVGDWSTLVNPGRRVPHGIQVLTGITDDMLAGAPRFEEVSAALALRLADKVLAAHNARFDYDFLRAEFARNAMRYEAPVLCTVRLSRRLYPQHRRHNLDALLYRHSIFCLDRHRALGDAQVLWELAQIWQRELGAAALDAACADLLRKTPVPAGLPADVYDTLPESPGVYVLHGDGGAVLYVEGGVNIRSLVMAHFGGASKPARNSRIAAEVKRVECIETAGSLGAHIRQAELVQSLAPIYNRKRRVTASAADALADKPWPFPGRIGIRERNHANDRCELHVLDRWRYLGTAHSEADLHELGEVSRESAFDPETYRLILRFLKSPPRTCDIVRLGQRAYSDA